MLLLAQPLDTSDPLLVSDSERTTILTPVPRPHYCYELPPETGFSADVRQWARRVRDADMQCKVNGSRRTAA